MYDEGVDHKCVYTRIDQEWKFFNFEEKNYYERARAPTYKREEKKKKAKRKKSEEKRKSRTNVSTYQ